jgi:hypothetical protein
VPGFIHSSIFHHTVGPTGDPLPHLWGVEGWDDGKVSRIPRDAVILVTLALGGNGLFKY